MDQRLADLLALLELEALEVNLFRGASRDIGSPQVFGGQVLGQALSAAARTVETARVVHSLHAYFLRRGDCNAPIVYQVDRSLDGHSFSNRRVVAIQHGEQIFNMAASFQVAEEGFDHQIDRPAMPLPQPETLSDYTGPPPEVLVRLPERVRRFFEQPRPFEFRMVQPIDYLREHIAAGAPDVVPRGRQPAGGRDAARLLAHRVGLLPLDNPAARYLVHAREHHHGEHRPRAVVSPAAARG
jgi:acyl-CoA thioesterase-2